MQSLVLVLNAGSSSIKFQGFIQDQLHCLFVGLVENIGTCEGRLSYEVNGEKQQQALGLIDYSAALQQIFSVYHKIKPADVVLAVIGHRVVHGGAVFHQAVVIDAAVIKQIEQCSQLAPLHNPVNLAGIFAAQQEFPEVLQVAVFDTAFHQTMPARAYLYAIPYHYYEQNQIRRYGFHGISYQYLTLQAAKMLNKPVAELALICAHLGNGCSVCGILAGKSVDTTMGFTPLEGLMMGTRSGDIDPGLFEYLAKTQAMSVEAITQMLNQKSGLLGISMQSMDMRVIQQAAASGDIQANLAIELFCYRLAKSIAALFVSIGRIDALVFSGGIGEHSALVREKTLMLLEFLGFALDIDANASHGADKGGRITTSSSRCALVIATQEELMIARESITLLKDDKLCP